MDARCASCKNFWGSNEEMEWDGYSIICKYCPERENMVQTKQLKIIAEVNGKQVPLKTISTETFEAIKALEKPKEIPVARLTTYNDDPNEPRLLFKPTENVRLVIGKIYSLDLKRGMVANWWEKIDDDFAIRQNYFGNVKFL